MALLSDEAGYSAEDHIQQGRAHYEVKDYEAAAESFKQAIRLDPNDAEAYRLLGFVCNELELLEEKLEAFGQAARLEPNSIRNLKLWGNALNQLERYDEAMEVFGRALSIEPDDYRANNFFGTSCLGLYLRDKNPEMLDKALAAQQRASQIEPANPDPHYELAFIHALKQNNEESSKEAQILADLDPEQYEDLMQQIGRINASAQKKSSSNLSAINLLSDRFEQSVKSESRSSYGNILLTAWDDDVILEGEKVLKLYEVELANAPHDTTTKQALAQHLSRMGMLFFQAILPTMMKTTVSDMPLIGAPAAERAASYFYRSYQLHAHPTTAYNLGALFNTAEFYATAAYWFDEAIRLAEQRGNEEAITLIKAAKLDLQADKKGDPLLSGDIDFPTQETPGFRSEFQPAIPARPVSVAPTPPPTPSSTPSSTPKAPLSQGQGSPAKSGCMGIILFVLIAIPALAAILTK